MTNCGCIYTFEVRLNGESGVVAKSIDELREPPDVKLSSFNILMRYDFNYCHVWTVAMCADTVQLTSRYSNSSSAKNVFGGVASGNALCVQQCGTDCSSTNERCSRRAIVTSVLASPPQ